MTNFDFLKQEPQFDVFADIAITAEKIFHIDVASSVLDCRKAMEIAVKWLYSTDSSLVMPYNTALNTLLYTDEFRKLIDNSMFNRLNYIRKLGNIAAHQAKNITKDEALLALQNLYEFSKFLAYCYSSIDVSAKPYDNTLPDKVTETVHVNKNKVELELLLGQTVDAKQELTALRKKKQKSYATFASSVNKPSEFTTRKLYIDVMLTDSGWIRNNDWLEEYEISTMPNKSNVGSADYVLLDDDGKPLAVIEAKKTCVSVDKGRMQAKLYADDLEKRFGRRPIIFLTNGFETRIIEDQKNGYPERDVSGIYSKRDLQKEFNKMNGRESLTKALINDDITNRPYQKAAIKATCEAFDTLNRRKALLTMATGTGKTRVAVSLVDILLRQGWITNFLFLADRNPLVRQAKRSFYNLLPNVFVTNLVEEKDNYNASGVFSTYQTMIGCIDDAKNESNDKLFTCGHFDLIILDEAHRSIYNKYKDIFAYFDSLVIGLTATPRDEEAKNTYAEFDLADEDPTYSYDLAQAVKEQYLVPFHTVRCKLKFMTEGIKYKDLSPDEKEEYEKYFTDENGNIPESIESSAINQWIFNEDTIRQALNTLMTMGLRVEYGNKIGKTIIFAKNHNHAEAILKVWKKDYPEYPDDYCTVIDNRINYAQQIIDNFSSPSKYPQIAISVDMLDTGIDVPEILNLVFFKQVFSKTKFWQMIGRGTRLCKNLLDTGDKKEFYIFDFCSNFEFFDMNSDGIEATTAHTLQEALFNLKSEIVFKLQDIAYQSESLKKLRTELAKELVDKASSLNRDNFAVKLHLRYVEYFSRAENYKALTFENIQQIRNEVAPLITPFEGDAAALRFDSLLYQLELSCLYSKVLSKPKNDLLRKVKAIATVASIPEIGRQHEFINTLLHTDYIDRAGVDEFENIRIKLRDLIKYIPHGPAEKYTTHFEDTLTEIDETPTAHPVHETSYGEKLEAFIRNNSTNPVIVKLKGNKPLSKQDVKELEKVVWNELGTKDDYNKQFGNVPLGELIRSMVGMDRDSVQAAFSSYISTTNLNSRQIYFVNQIIDYISKNGVMKDLSVLQQAPFNDKGSVVDLFGQDQTTWENIRKVINQINSNALIH